MSRDFNTWFNKFIPFIADYSYYFDFAKVINHVNTLKHGMSMLNSLIGSKNIESDFEKLITGDDADDVSSRSSASNGAFPPRHKNVVVDNLITKVLPWQNDNKHQTKLKKEIDISDCLS